MELRGSIKSLVVFDLWKSKMEHVWFMHIIKHYRILLLCKETILYCDEKVFIYICCIGSVVDRIPCMRLIV